MKRKALLRSFVALLFIRCVAAGPAPAAILFDDSTDTIVLGNDAYFELGISKQHGAIVYIHDRLAGSNVSLGNAYLDLWRLKFIQYGTVRSSTFSPGSATRDFSYQWDPEAATLSLSYHLLETTHALDVSVHLRPTESTCLDLDASIDNGYHDTAEIFYFPCQLAFDKDEVEQFYFPYYEGVAFQRSFFQELRSVTQSYQHVFADFGALESTQGNLAVYMLPGASFQPATLGLKYAGWSGGVSVYDHLLNVYIPDQTTWSPPTTRLLIASPIEETLEAFRVDRGIEAAPDLERKLGSELGPFAEALLVKIDCQHVHDWGWPGTQSTFAWVDSVAALLPKRSLLHLVSFWPGGFDNNYPDYVPPNPDYGTIEEFNAVFLNATARGQLTMPYTNPTWWDDQSPTFLELGTDIAARNRTGTPIYECYGSNCGYVICPAHPDVRARLAQTIEDFNKDFTIDILFEDQVADRPWLYDTNPAEPACTAYTDALITNATTGAEQVHLATEGMLDVLVPIELGFFDSVMLDKKAGWISSWGDANWRPYPLTMLVAHDKVLFRQHNLAVEVMTHNKEMLTYNLAHGFGLNLDLTGSTGMLESEWLDIAGAFQRYVAAECTGKRMTEFSYLNAEKTVTRSVFEDVEVIGNHTLQPYDWGGYRIAAQGCLATTADGQLRAGVFTRFNNHELGGEHYLIQDRPNVNRIRIEQPSGADVVLHIDRPVEWGDDPRIKVEASCTDGTRIDVTRDPSTLIAADYIEFLWKREQYGHEVEFYRLRYKPPELPPAEIADGEDLPVPGLRLELRPCHPNPFHDRTAVAYALPDCGRVRLQVLDLNGRLVRTLADEVQDAQMHVAAWDGRDDRGRTVESGIYLIRLEAGARSLITRSILLK